MDDGCPSKLVIKAYPGTTRILGSYKEVHSHPLGSDNARFTRIPHHVREFIAQQLRNKVDPDEILRVVHQGAFDDPLALKDRKVVRTDFITLADIRYIAIGIEAETIRLAKDDEESTLEWVKQLREQDMLLGFKAVTDPVPEGSNLASDTFFLAIQHPWQREVHEEIAETVLCIDGTHNTTQYYNCNLYTVLGRDKWGHGTLVSFRSRPSPLTLIALSLPTGIPLAWLIASNGQEETLAHYLRLYQARNPKAPRWFMSDRDQAQLNAIRLIYLAVQLLLCWWHVLHAWQQHFSTSDFPELWEQLKKWIRITDEKEFQDAWTKIQQLSPASFREYLERHWITCTSGRVLDAYSLATNSLFQVPRSGRPYTARIGMFSSL